MTTNLKQLIQDTVNAIEGCGFIHAIAIPPEFFTHGCGVGVVGNGDTLIHMIDSLAQQLDVDQQLQIRDYRVMKWVPKTNTDIVYWPFIPSEMFNDN